MKKIIFVTTLKLWSMDKGCGGPAFTQTIKKYIDEGWDVYLLSDETSNSDYPFLDSNHNIVIKATIFKKYCLLRKIGLVFRFLDHFFATKSFIGEINKIVNSSEDVGVLYAYEIFGVKACAKIAKEKGWLLVTRFQGTILCAYKNNILNRICRYPHFNALSQEADLVVMTDDGTQGYQVLETLKNCSRALFMKNGLELLDDGVLKIKQKLDIEEFRKKLGVSKDEFMFLTVSRLVGWKKVDRAIRGFAEFRRNNASGKLVIVGDGDAKSQLISLAHDLGVEKSVLFVGSVQHSMVYNYMIASDIFLSLYDLSNVGNPLLEAMALGKCIITLDVGDTKTVIQNRKNGILLTYDTLNQLGNVMLDLVKNSSIVQQLGQAAEEYACKNLYGWKKRMEIEYSEVVRLLECK